MNDRYLETIETGTEQRPNLFVAALAVGLTALVLVAGLVGAVLWMVL